MTTVSLSTVQVTQLIDLLTVTAAGADDEDRYQLDYRLPRPAAQRPIRDRRPAAGRLSGPPEGLSWSTGAITPIVECRRSWLSSAAASPPAAWCPDT
jgi:hypothetical protein